MAFNKSVKFKYTKKTISCLINAPSKYVLSVICYFRDVNIRRLITHKHTQTHKPRVDQGHVDDT